MIEKNSSRCTAVVQSEATYMKTVRSLLSYTRIFETDYVVQFVNFRVIDIMSNMCLSNCLAPISRETHIPYNKV